MTDCGTYATTGSRCINPHGHTGPHKSSFGFQWTDESNRKAAQQIAESMEGHRD